ncbi:hypothetical protein IFR04_014846 [Cadophora malorum]|uniref:Heterokaryon incompatibility domain-containing protein n=1 Tax=Cadophora malorum TaxID=108018 RepID=A0A8H7T215_9HELO|nr:hypothetical protein IFR04_014846 [Cadophora malorum]
MRLLNTSTFRLESFFGRELPIYAILSHTWGDDEVTLQDMANPEESGPKSGYTKLRGCCRKAAEDGYEYVWIDTCWTVEFYTAGWEEIGTKQSLGKEIAEITGIDVRVLRGRDPSEYHVAERMSWAASRTTTRIEDMSYCLLGVFKIHMPLLYGEGNRAFIRLQEEILRTTYDYTILARGFHQSLEGLGSVWTQSIPLTQNYPLATDISPFSVVDRSEEGRYHNLIKDNDTSVSTENKQQTVTGGSAQFPLLLTAKGLYITLPMRKVSPTLSLAYLHCKLRQPDKTDKIICMALTELSPGRYQRSGTGPAFQQHYQFMPEHALSSFEISTFYIKQEYTSTQPRSKTLGPGIPKMRIEVEAPIECKMFDSEALSKGEMLVIRAIGLPMDTGGATVLRHQRFRRGKLGDLTWDLRAWKRAQCHTGGLIFLASSRKALQIVYGKLCGQVSAPSRYRSENIPLYLTATWKGQWLLRFALYSNDRYTPRARTPENLLDVFR